LIYCTPLDDFLQVLQKLHMPYQLAFVLTTAIRFVPTMEHKTENILEAQRARGSQVGSGNFITRIRTYIPVMVPMMVEAVRMSETLAVAMLNRGYGARPRATPLKELKMEPRDYTLSILFLVLILAGIILKYLGLGQL
jgi:energy-coupling factor transport system permease protein